MLHGLLGWLACLLAGGERVSSRKQTFPGRASSPLRVAARGFGRMPGRTRGRAVAGAPASCAARLAQARWAVLMRIFGRERDTSAALSRPGDQHPQNGVAPRRARPTCSAAGCTGHVTTVRRSYAALRASLASVG
eukprot:289465-Chlamydomonas_euryale.AAC.3